MKTIIVTNGILIQELRQGRGEDEMGFKKQYVAWLLLLSLLAGIMAGCSSGRTASAEINEKLELAVKYLSEQQYEKAILAYQKVIKIDSKNIIAYKGLSLAYVLQEKPDKAEQAIQDGLKAVPQNIPLQLALAGLMLDQGKADQAEAIYKELLSKDSPPLSAYKAYTYYLSQNGKQAEAITLLERAAANTRDYRLNSLLAELYIKNGDSDKALAAINKSLTAEINQSAAYQQLAELYKDKWEELVTLGDLYMRQNQEELGIIYKLSGLYGMERYEELIKEYEQLAANFKDTPRIRLIAAQAYLKSGQKDEAGKNIKLIKMADIQDAGMLADLASYYLESGDKENARKLALLGISADDTAIENYVVMYRSYEGEDKNLAQMWAMKYLLTSIMSYKDDLSQLADYGVELGFKMQSEEELASKEIVGAIVKDQAYAEAIEKRAIKAGRGPLKGTCYCNGIYLDTKNNIAYEGYCEYATNWTPFIVRHHSPTFYTIEQIPIKIIDIMTRNESWSYAVSKSKKYPKFLILHRNTWIAPLMFEDTIPLEEHLKRAGYPIENVTFIDM